MPAINLLPPERRLVLQRRIILAASLHLAQMLLFILIVMSLAGAGAAGAVRYISARNVRASADMLAEQAQKYIEQRNTINDKNSLLSAINRLGKERQVWSQQIARLLAAAPAGLRIHSIRSGRGTDAVFLTFSGRAATRNSLVEFDGFLRSLPWVSAVDAPGSNLLLPVNPPYTFTLHLKENNEQANN